MTLPHVCKDACRKYRGPDLGEEGKGPPLLGWQSEHALDRITACNMGLKHPEFKFSWDLCCMSPSLLSLSRLLFYSLLIGRGEMAPI